MVGLRHSLVKPDYADKRMPRLKTEIPVVFLNGVCLVEFHIRDFSANIMTMVHPAKPVAESQVIRVHPSVTMVAPSLQAWPPGHILAASL